LEWQGCVTGSKFQVPSFRVIWAVVSLFLAKNLRRGVAELTLILYSGITKLYQQIYCLAKRRYKYFPTTKEVITNPY
jgi:hypothetical protein